jgi:hypothetical protein
MEFEIQQRESKLSNCTSGMVALLGGSIFGSTAGTMSMIVYGQDYTRTEMKNQLTNDPQLEKLDKAYLIGRSIGQTLLIILAGNLVYHLIR